MLGVRAEAIKRGVSHVASANGVSAGHCLWRDYDCQSRRGSGILGVQAWWLLDNMLADLQTKSWLTNSKKSQMMRHELGC